MIYFQIDDTILRLSDQFKLSVRMVANFWPWRLEHVHKVFLSSSSGIFFLNHLQNLQSEEINSKLEIVLETQINNILYINTNHLW